MSNIDWPGLLKWSLRYQDQSNNTTVRTISPEDRQFLENAMAEAMKNDPTKIAAECIAKLTDSNDDVVITALDVMERCLDEYPEIAVNIEKMGGIGPFIKIIQTRREPVVLRCLQVYAPMFPNNTVAQQAAGSRNAIRLLMKHISDPLSPQCQTSAFTCLAAIVRHEPSLEKAFLKEGGVNLLVDHIQLHKPIKVQMKACNLLTHYLSQNLIPSNEIMKDLAQAVGELLKATAQSHSNSNIDYSELMANLALTIASHHPISTQWEDRKITLLDGLRDRLAFCNSIVDTDAALEVEIRILVNAINLLTG